MQIVGAAAFAPGILRFVGIMVRYFASGFAALALLYMLAGPAAAAGTQAATCHRGARGLGALQAAVAQARFVAYHPTAQQMWYGHADHADEASIKADLKALRPWFNGLVTYGVTHGSERIADVAAKLGYRAIILGVWDPHNHTEINNALAAAARHPKLVVGLAIGNEVVLSGRGTWGDLSYALARVRKRAPNLPLAITEPFDKYLDDPEAHSTLAAMDFMLTNVHPIFQPWFRGAKPANWADFVGKVGTLLQAKFCGPVIVKETGVPTGPKELHYTPQMQADFYSALQKRVPRKSRLHFVYFTAFDQRWHTYDADPKTGPHPEEGFWGMMSETRKPKLFLRSLPKLPVSKTAAPKITTPKTATKPAHGARIGR